MKYLLPLLLLLLAPLTGCDPSDDIGLEEGQTITDLVVAAGDLTTLEAAVIAAGLDDDLAGGEFTVFAPTDAAFATLLGQLNLTAEELLALDDLGDILGLHVIADGTFEADDLEDGATFTALNGGTLTVIRDGGSVGIDFDGDDVADATVTQADIEATNGVVHKIDTVLFDVPEPTQTITELVVAANDLTVLEQAVITAELDDDLAGDGPFTVFAPTDAAFTTLLGQLDLTAEELLALDNLGDILGLHVVAGSALFAADLEDGATVTTLSGETLTVVLDGGSVGIDFDGDDTADATVIAADIAASNGVVHKIDTVLFDVPAPTITQLVVDTDDLSILEQAVITAGLDDDLAGDGPFTVFAPTDAAFTQLLDDLDITAEELLAREDLADILTLHVLTVVVMSGDLADGAEVTSLNGQTLTVRALDGGGFGLDTEDDGDDANATIIQADIEASNGVVHLIDAVLIPAEG